MLSAGQGRRLLPLTANRPKCLIRIGDRSVLEWQLDALLEADTREIVVVSGYRSDLVEALVARRYARRGVRVEFNPFFDITDNLASCWIARAAMDGDFLLLNGDIIFETAVLRRVLDSTAAPITLAVNIKDEYDDDDMKVKVTRGVVRRVSKTLAPQQTSGESIGMLYFRDSGVALFRAAVDSAIRHPPSLNLWYLSIIDALAADGIVRACPVTGLGWAELDFPSDLEIARATFGGSLLHQPG
ncbi:MAG: phosphocholine cytidylyltransferase family protein [Gammaproteobacteria bacterium]|nr:phosphocholine cytidylyltransferase family protein [Gammaproteobacteria bacterium]